MYNQHKLVHVHEKHPPMRTEVGEEAFQVPTEFILQHTHSCTFHLLPQTPTQHMDLYEPCSGPIYNYIWVYVWSTKGPGLETLEQDGQSVCAAMVTVQQGLSAVYSALVDLRMLIMQSDVRDQHILTAPWWWAAVLLMRCSSIISSRT